MVRSSHIHISGQIRPYSYQKTAIQNGKLLNPSKRHPGGRYPDLHSGSFIWSYCCVAFHNKAALVQDITAALISLYYPTGPFRHCQHAACYHIPSNKKHRTGIKNRTSAVICANTKRKDHTSNHTGTGPEAPAPAVCANADLLVQVLHISIFYVADIMQHGISFLHDIDIINNITKP